MRVIIKIKSEEMHLEFSREMLHVFANYYHWTTLYEKDSSHKAREAKRRWQKKADEFFQRYAVPKTEKEAQIKIKVAE